MSEKSNNQVEKVAIERDYYRNLHLVAMEEIETLRRQRNAALMRVTELERSK